MNRLELSILKSLIYNEEFTRKVIPFIDAAYFSDQTERNVYQEVSDFVNKYKALPTHEALVINFTEKKNLSDEQVHGAIKLLKELDDNKDEPTQTEWLVEQTEKFCQDRAIYNAIMESVSILDDTKGTRAKGEIPQLLSDALGVSFDQNVGHDYTQDSESRYDFYHRKESRIKTDLDLLNRITKDGFPKKTLNIILAGTGVGKSMMMCHLASSCISNGNNVLYITLELAEEELAKRIDANLLNLTMDELLVIPREDYARKFSTLKNKTHGKLIIKEYPTASAHAGHFRALFQELKIKKNFTPDIVFIDYLNICASSRTKMGSSVNSYTYIKSIAEELRGLAVEANVPVVSATQTTRSGFCLDVNTTVTSKRGDIKISDVCIGDELSSDTGWNVVKTVFPQTRKKMYRIKTESGKEITASEDHLFPTETGEKNIKGGLGLQDRLFVDELG